MSDSDSRYATEIVPGRASFWQGLRDVWVFRELVGFLVLRDILVRYKQSFLGVAWALLQPAALMLIMTAVFSRLARVPSDGVPYPVFVLCALLPWNLFASAVSRAGVSVVNNATLVTKVYFPRLIIPVAASLAPVVDFAVSLFLLALLMVYYRISPGPGVMLMPLFLLLALTTSLGCSLWLSAIHVRYRDVHHILPLMLQIWMYAVPIAYPLSLIPKQWREVYMLDPMAAVVEGFRWSMLGTGPLPMKEIAVACGSSIVILVSGVWFFQAVEGRFSDEI